jgi:cell division protein ZapA
MSRAPRSGMRQLEVTILGQGYVLACPEGGEALLTEAVTQVDREMSAIRDAGKVKARERIAVLAALNLAYQLAERAAQPAPEPQAIPPLATPAAPGAAAAAEDSAGVDLDGLIRRIDQALGDDGRLL